MAEFGEQVMGKLTKKKPICTKKAKRGKTKLTAQSIRGTWLGIHPRTGEHLLAVHTGEVVRVRTIHRLPAEKQWDAEAVLAIRATPRSPRPREDRKFSDWLSAGTPTPTSRWWEAERRPARSTHGNLSS